MVVSVQSIFDAHLKSLEIPKGGLLKVGVAVSGGSDSMAACLAAVDWAQRMDVQVVGLTVDHGLRPEARQEAELVAEWLSKIGMEHHILTWKGPHPRTGIQQAARNARYRLLKEKCKQLGANLLIMGHQLEDQLETFLMRMAKGSGVQGLSVMAATREQDGIIISRPFLSVSRQQLRDFLKKSDQQWIDDPSNDNPVFTRTHLGRALEILADLPESNLQSLEMSVTRTQRADGALSTITEQYLRTHVVESPLGFVRFSKAAIEEMPDEIAIRFLQRLFIFVRGTGQGPQMSALERLQHSLKTDQMSKAKTLFGCQLLRQRDQWILCREPGRTDLPEKELTNNRVCLWDDRFEIRDTVPGTNISAQDCPRVRVIGDDGWQQLKESPEWQTPDPLPSIVKKNLPSIWIGAKIVSMPLFSYNLDAMGIAQGRFEMVFKPKCHFLS
ncbi:tRNA lysidine(34) synthetase TilS [Sneathiella sp.]|jgi:tRNA(Ile)-lysidine synthase|uniref:tRNA lysidine(34) synthetase TilS n=1 Tax=Sneathiella sp. TaxID=1964365 RepID=UPI0039E2A3A8